MAVGLELARFDTRMQAQRALEELGIDPAGAGRLGYKAILQPVVLRGIKGGAANLLKQELLARGGDAAVPSVSVMHPDTLVDICLLGTLQDYKSLLPYLRQTPILGLPRLADALAELLGAEIG